MQQGIAFPWLGPEIPNLQSRLQFSFSYFDRVIHTELVVPEFLDVGWKIGVVQ